MDRTWIGIPLLLASIGLHAANGVTVVNVNGNNGAWIGYSDGSVRFCNGGGGTAVPFWTRCTLAVPAGGAAVSDISNSERRAWIGHADGRLRYCRESGSDQNPVTECVDVQP